MRNKVRSTWNLEMVQLTGGNRLELSMKPAKTLNHVSTYNIHTCKDAKP